MIKYICFSIILFLYQFYFFNYNFTNPSPELDSTRFRSSFLDENPFSDSIRLRYPIPIIDISEKKEFQVVVDKEKDKYLGHPTTVLLDDNKTIITVYPMGHGSGQIIMKRSLDGGLTWSERLLVPKSWSSSKEVPTIFKVYDKNGKRRIILFSGLYPIRMSISEDDGNSWSELEPIGDFGGIVAMGCVEKLRSGKGNYIAMFHDDGRFFNKDGKKSDTMTLYKTFSFDGGLKWSQPEVIFKSSEVNLCEPGIIRSPDGKRLAVLLRENSRKKNSHIIFSTDEGKSWSVPKELPITLTGDRHTGKYLKDGRLFISFRDITPNHDSPTEGDWVGWIGTYNDLVKGKNGQYRIRLMDNKNSWDCAYPGVEVLQNGTIVTTTYGHWEEGEKPFIVTLRFKPKEVEKISKNN